MSLQVDTYGSMQREEKVRFVLEQMRLCLARKDFVRAQIVSKKISTRFFSESESDEVQASLFVFPFNYVITHNCYSIYVQCNITYFDLKYIVHPGY